MPVPAGAVEGVMVAGAVVVVEEVPVTGVVEEVPLAGVDGTVDVGALTVPLPEPETPGVPGACVFAGETLAGGGVVLV